MSGIVPDYQTPRRMASKLAAVPLPDLDGKRVLDVGCDMGAWSIRAVELGAVHVLGLDRGREVRGAGVVDLAAYNRAQEIARAAFESINIGKQWRVFGRFDVLLVMSVYHHIYENCGDHHPIWYWLWRHCTARSEILWEGPVDDSDPVVRANVSDQNRVGYTIDAILAAASFYFAAERIGPALHEPTREVWRFRPHQPQWLGHIATLRDGSGGATKAFLYAGARRATEIERALGWRPVPGSLNLRLDHPFGWDDGYFRTQILDVVDRSRGLDSEWAPRWARFYPVTIDGEDACAFRFEGEKYPPTFMELIASRRLRDTITSDRVTVRR